MVKNAPRALTVTITSVIVDPMRNPIRPPPTRRASSMTLVVPIAKLPHEVDADAVEASVATWEREALERATAIVAQCPELQAPTVGNDDATVRPGKRAA